MLNESILEKDLFYLIFFRKELKDDTVSFLEEGDYVNDIAFIKELKNGLTANLPVKTKEKIKEKIKCYYPASKILLTLIKYNLQNNEKNFNRESLEENLPVSSATYSDKGNTFLLRLINYHNFSKIFLFSRHESLLRNFSLEFKPSGESFTQSENTLPLKIDHQIFAEYIELEFL